MTDLNRKSKNGHRALSRVPRGHRMPPWSTTPPTAKEETEIMDPEPIERMRQVLRGMVLTMTDSSADQQTKMTAAIASMDDTRLAALAQESLFNFKRAKASFEGIELEMKNLRKTVSDIRAENVTQERAVLEVQKAIKERDDIAAKYKELQKQIDPEKHQLEIMYAIEEATASLKEESGGLRRELGQRQTEINDLRASKKRLREALDRLAGKD